MKHILYYTIVLCLLLTSCGRKTIPSKSTNTRDSIRVEYIEKIRDVIVEVPIPVEVIVTTTPADSVSVLQTSLAKSRAALIGGMLHHSLENRIDNNPTITIPVKDSIIKEYVYQEVIVNIPYEVKADMTKWQIFRMYIGSLSLILISLIIVFFVVKKFVIKQK